MTLSSFGSCCSDLAEAMNPSSAESLFRVEENGVLYLTVGLVRTKTGTGFMNQAVLFCPFCGKALQTRAAIAAASQEPS